MNLIISGDNPQNLAKVEAMAKNLGLTVSRELSVSSNSAGVSLRRGKASKSGANSRDSAGVRRESASSKEGPLYGIE